MQFRVQGAEESRSVWKPIAAKKEEKKCPMVSYNDEITQNDATLR